MSTFDLVLIILLGIGTFKGYGRGFIVEIFSFIAFFVGLYLALELTIPVSNELFGGSNYFEIASIFVFIVLFIFLSMAIKVGAKALKNAIDMTLFGSLDNIAGAVIGILKWAFVLSVIFWVFESVGFDLTDRYADETILFPYIVHIAPAVFEWLSYILPFLKDMIDSLENMPKKNNTFMTFLIVL
ncbi:CvpA family protein [Ekhidna sp.]